MIICKVINKKTGIETNRWDKSKFPLDYYESGFGKPERWVKVEDCSQNDIDYSLANRETEFNGLEYKLAAEYEMIEEDLTLDIQAEKWKVLRTKRDQELKNSDHTQLVDSTLNSEQKQVWRVYRQALRDLPQQSGDPDNIIWPEKPE